MNSKYVVAALRFLVVVGGISLAAFSFLGHSAFKQGSTASKVLIGVQVAAGIAGLSLFALPKYYPRMYPSKLQDVRWDALLK